MHPANNPKWDTEAAAADVTFLRTVLTLLLGLSLGNAMIVFALL